MAKVLIPLLLVGLVLPGLLVGCTKTEGAETEYNMTTKAAIPLIDTYVPPAVETVTFALG
jgi:hypothetical protein